jgi:uncharacterized protein YcbX
MQVAALWRYPVKSLQGEPLELAAVTTAGVEGDRRFALFDMNTRFSDDGGVDITLPNGSVTRDDDALSAWLGRRVTLRSADAEVAPQYESPLDFEDEKASDWTPWDGASGAYHDSAKARVSLVSMATIGAWDPRRFRANVYLDGEGEDALTGSKVTLGGATLNVGKRLERCVMTTRAQAGGVERDLDVLRTINRERDGCLAVGALVRQPGTVRVGDRLTLA